jgi:hypothetical protein
MRRALQRAEPERPIGFQALSEGGLVICITDFVSLQTFSAPNARRARRRDKFKYYNLPVVIIMRTIFIYSTNHLYGILIRVLLIVLYFHLAIPLSD